MLKLKKVNILGVGVHVLNMELAVRVIGRAIETRRKGYVCVTSVHGLIVAQEDKQFKEILNHSLLTTPDGMPLVWFGRLSGYAEMERVYGPDLMLAVMRSSIETGWTHFFYGGLPGVAERLKTVMEGQFPGIKIVGTYTPPFRPLNEQEEKQLISIIEASKPDIIWVGLSTPKQECFMAKYLPLLHTSVMIGVGAAFDFHTGRIPQAPRWVQRIGMEWFFRLCAEPKRLWRRYFKNNPLFIWLAFCQATGLRKFPLEVSQEEVI